jgi:hypothetical protein
MVQESWLGVLVRRGNEDKDEDNAPVRASKSIVCTNMVEEKGSNVGFVITTLIG